MEKKDDSQKLRYAEETNAYLHKIHNYNKEFYGEGNGDEEKIENAGKFKMYVDLDYEIQLRYPIKFSINEQSRLKTINADFYCKYFNKKYCEFYKPIYKYSFNDLSHQFNHIDEMVNLYSEAYEKVLEETIFFDCVEKTSADYTFLVNLSNLRLLLSLETVYDDEIYKERLQDKKYIQAKRAISIAKISKICYNKTLELLERFIIINVNKDQQESESLIFKTKILNDKLYELLQDLDTQYRFLLSKQYEKEYSSDSIL